MPKLYMLFIKRLRHIAQFFYCMRGRKILLHYAADNDEGRDNEVL